MRLGFQGERYATGRASCWKGQCHTGRDCGGVDRVRRTDRASEERPAISGKQGLYRSPITSIALPPRDTLLIYGTDVRGARCKQIVSRKRGATTFADNRASEYRRLARECLRLAQTIATEEARLALVEMARVWTRLAEEQDVPYRRMPMPEDCQPAVQQQQQVLSKKGDLE